MFSRKSVGEEVTVPFSREAFPTVDGLAAFVVARQRQAGLEFGQHVLPRPQFLGPKEPGRPLPDGLVVVVQEEIPALGVDLVGCDRLLRDGLKQGRGPFLSSEEGLQDLASGSGGMCHPVLEEKNWYLRAVEARQGIDRRDFQILRLLGIHQRRQYRLHSSQPVMVKQRMDSSLSSSEADSSAAILPARSMWALIMETAEAGSLRSPKSDPPE